MKKKLQLNVLMLFLSWNKSKEERKGKKERKTRNQKKTKNNDEGRKKEQERDSERNWKRGGQKRLRRNKGRDSQENKKLPFLGGRQVFSIGSKERKEKKAQKQKTQKYQKKELVSYQSNFSFVLGGCPKFPFLTTCPKKRAPKHHYKNRGFSKAFFGKKTDMRHETAIFGQTKPKSRNSSYHFFLPFSSLFSNTKHPN